LEIILITSAALTSVFLVWWTWMQSNTAGSSPSGGYNCGRYAGIKKQGCACPTKIMNSECRETQRRRPAGEFAREAACFSWPGDIEFSRW